ncbi:hypothetical protein L207DRAFT_632471 [Hyaloscypha variabilis F]|uniref:MJ1316 RNA cyclic group end recognition domain-containing protein n=1 Tax=Hyaloscypha variabilis (strain UAMH 11265 / GT02V1 / F) TaxID=1149755 RepID=A0A2J6RW48_HYAVF|nr:hypothetical protein L207DRAFT_632471 [Hyaloscypha variabilis F]
MEAFSSDFEKLAVDSAMNCDLEPFIWPSYIRLKVSISSTDLSSSLNSISTQLGDLCSALNSALAIKEGKLWPTPLTDTSESYFFLIGLPALPSPDLAKARQLLKEWQKEIVKKLKGEGDARIEVKIISRKVFEESRFEVYSPPSPRVAGVETETGEQIQQTRNKKERKEAFPAAGNFKKVKGSNPAEVRRQFLEHTLNSSSSGSSTSTPEANSKFASSGNTKLRPGKEVLKRLKFDQAYNVEDYVVGYIDRKEGILECSVAEWEMERGGERREELLAYVKERGSGVVVWDKVRKIDLVFGGKG